MAINGVLELSAGSSLTGTSLLQTVLPPPHSVCWEAKSENHNTEKREPVWAVFWANLGQIWVSCPLQPHESDLYNTTCWSSLLKDFVILSMSFSLSREIKILTCFAEGYIHITYSWLTLRENRKAQILFECVILAVRIETTQHEILMWRRYLKNKFIHLHKLKI